MPIYPHGDAVVHLLHGSRFSSYVAPSRGSGELCAWRLDVPAGSLGAAHRVSREEVLLVLAGRLLLSLDGDRTQVDAGDVIAVPAGSELRIDGGDADAAAWVTTTIGLEATTSDGQRLRPPWTQ